MTDGEWLWRCAPTLSAALKAQQDAVTDVIAQIEDRLGRQGLPAVQRDALRDAHQALLQIQDGVTKTQAAIGGRAASSTGVQ